MSRTLDHCVVPMILQNRDHDDDSLHADFSAKDRPAFAWPFRDFECDAQSYRTSMRHEWCVKKNGKVDGLSLGKLFSPSLVWKKTHFSCRSGVKEVREQIARLPNSRCESLKFFPSLFWIKLSFQAVQVLKPTNGLRMRQTWHIAQPRHEWYEGTNGTVVGLPIYELSHFFPYFILRNMHFFSHLGTKTTKRPPKSAKLQSLGLSDMWK